MLHEHHAIIQWDADGAVFTDGKYSRAHQWTFDGGIVVPASASPHVVRLPYSQADAVDPEEAFVAAIASCHMLTFLHLASKKRIKVLDYTDDAVGFMENNGDGVPWVARVVLRPRISYHGKAPGDDVIASLHHAAHKECFIANSVRTEILVELL